MSFKINGLDHVAIRVSDLEASALWYESVLGLKKYQTEKWGPFPIFLLSGKSGLALFPESGDDSEASLSRVVDHFAFNVDQAEFVKAMGYLKSQKINYHFQDHHYFHSLYLKDPDGHTVELTCLVVDEEEFYGK